MSECPFRRKPDSKIIARLYQAGFPKYVIKSLKVAIDGQEAQFCKLRERRGNLLPICWFAGFSFKNCNVPVNLSSGDISTEEAAMYRLRLCTNG